MNTETEAAHQGESEMVVIETPIAHTIRLNGKEYDYFAGNNYLGLANHPELKKAAVSAVETYGINVSASRETTGTASVHLALEKAIAEFKDKEAAVVFASGYLSNTILAEALQDRYDSVFMDEMSHPSIRNSIRGTAIPVHLYRHKDIDDLHALVRRHAGKNPLFMTDGIFPLTGDIAPLQDIAQLAEQVNALVIVDDAHATGVIGDNARGTPDYFGLHNHPRVFQTETMSKALGVYGGFIASLESDILDVRRKSSAYIGSTALPPSLSAAALAAFTLLRREPVLRTRLSENTRLLREGILSLGYETSTDPTPIIPVFLAVRNEAVALSVYFQEHAVIAPYIHYPVETGKFIVRLTVSAAHTAEQIERVLTLLKRWRNEREKT
ncbi:pyridoxal phosphate-dependent aminotransferase family protein [bacterium]|nr:pyridoxal phosphate-dependent aminotransferase family protein [bacterium]